MDEVAQQLMRLNNPGDPLYGLSLLALPFPFHHRQEDQQPQTRQRAGKNEAAALREAMFGSTTRYKLAKSRNHAP